MADQRELIEAISDMALSFAYEVHDIYEETSTSDLQGMADALAMRVVELEKAA